LSQERVTAQVKALVKEQVEKLVKEQVEALVKKQVKELTTKIGAEITKTQEDTYVYKLGETSCKYNLGYIVLLFIKLYFYETLPINIKSDIDKTLQEFNSLPWEEPVKTSIPHIHCGNNLVFDLLGKIFASLNLNLDLKAQIIYLLIYWIIPLQLNGTSHLIKHIPNYDDISTKIFNENYMPKKNRIIYKDPILLGLIGSISETLKATFEKGKFISTNQTIKTILTFILSKDKITEKQHFLTRLYKILIS
jgi:hypothetical protein